eukprot:g3065.t1
MVVATRVLVVALLCGSVMISATEPRLIKSNSECLEPPTGTWYMKHLIQIAPGNYTYRFSSILKLEKESDNIFIGTTNTTDHSDHSLLSLTLTGVFNTDVCVMSGAMVNRESKTADTFKWTYNGETMDGYFIASIAGRVVSHLYNIHELSHEV